ncbi:MAG: molybdopterin-containing oxidoreductase family protein, partial [Gammaproteobacteria bacterium]
MSAKDTITARTMCPMNCHPTFCGMEVIVQGNEIVSITGDPANPDSEGFLCVRGLAAREIPHNPKRILHPLMRDKRNSDTWHTVSWDVALNRIVEVMDQSGREHFGIWPSHGSVANDFGVFAHASLALRFANMAGLQWWDLSMICWGLGGFGLGLTGALEVNTKEDMSANADLIVQWGSNHASQPNTARHVAAAKKRGAKVIAIDIRRSDACRSAHEHFIVKPGTDAAMALAMIHVIIAEELFDAAFVEAQTLGFEQLKTHVQDFTPQWAAAICGVEPERIAAFAREYAATERAMLLLSGASMYKDQNGWESSRAISCLPALTGKLGKPGTGFGPRPAGLPHGHGLGDIVNFAARPPGQYIP